MSVEGNAAPSRLAGFLLSVVALVILTPVGLHVAAVVAQVTGGPLPPQLLVAADPISDSVTATSAEFRVDESGSATYQIPIYVVPGTAGVEPDVALSYSSQAGYGPLGEGWSITGLSSITRCRATREAGDFIGAATPDGTPRPVNFTATDRFCLDGMRLVPSSESCPSAGGMTGVALATEIESFRRVCAYSAAGGKGPSFFTVEGKDGSTSWYGDRDASASANRPDGIMESNAYGASGAALFWAQTRLMDSTGNTIDYVYLKNPTQANSGEHLIKEIRYTGKVALPGQSVSLAPYAKIQFNYSTRPATRQTSGYVAGGSVLGSMRLDSITSCATAGASCPTSDQARHMVLTYGTSTSGSDLDTLIGVQECRDDTGAVCAAPTSFVWAAGQNAFATYEKPGSLAVDTGSYRNHKLADVNGDGRTDLIYLRNGNVSCATSWLTVMLGTLNASGIPTFTSSQSICLPASISDRGRGAWHVFDYNGDGRDDLFVARAGTAGWGLFPSTGTGFDMAQDLLAGMSPVIPSTFTTATSDVNGDGLIDIYYSSKMRVMERQGATFKWGAERSFQVNMASIPRPIDCDDPNNTCTLNSVLPSSSVADYTQLIDFNGDSAADLVGMLNWELEIYTPEHPDCPDMLAARRGIPGVPTSGYQELPYREVDPTDNGPRSVVVPLADPCYERRVERSTVAWKIDALTPTAIGASYYADLGPYNPVGLEFADANGDGLTDVFVRYFSTSDWQLMLNSGDGMRWSPSGALTTPFKDEVRFADVSGDGRADMLYLVDYGSYKAYAVRKALPSGGFAAGATLAGNNARICEGSGCDQRQRIPVFTDLDGDGNQDFLSLSMAAGLADVYISRSNQRFQPRDVITRFVNGLGNETDVTYAPMTLQDLYRRDTGTRNAANWGRGSPVQDVIAPSYLVARVASSSPQAGNPAAKASLHYRYAGAKMQAGGRGYLGFREIVVYDPNEVGGYVATTTTYAQNFPFVASPLQTVKAALLNQTYSVPACLAGTITNSCFSGPGPAFPAVGGSWFANNVHSWEVAPASLTTQAPLHVRTQGTEESVGDPYTGAQTARVATAYSYGARGNASQTVVDTYTGASTLTSTLITTNTYTDDVARWRLGRLTSSTITHRRPGQPDVVRTTGFGYDMAGAVTGLMTAEHVQPGGAAAVALSKAYTLDSFGNRVQETACAAPATSCSTAGFTFQPSSVDPLRRYSRVEFDARGRYPVANYEPFWSMGGGEELATLRVVERNIFGDPTVTYDATNTRTVAVKGLLGRDFFVWTQSDPMSPSGLGLSSKTNYRWCAGANSVNCPVGATYRKHTVSTGKPRTWSYHDALGRSVLEASETMNVGVNGQDVAGVCKTYDAAGRANRTSNPFFLPGTGGTDGPTAIGTVCTAPERLWATTTFDILGRPTLVQMPDGSQIATTYAGATTTVRDQRNNATSQTLNGKGEVVSVVDAAGLQTAFAYTSDGNLRTVTRNAGAGAITNTFTYDLLGRKIQQVDPDAGMTTLTYNAFGELTSETDNGGFRTEHEYDARGRVWRKTAKLANGTIETQSTFEYDAGAPGKVSREEIAGAYSAWTGEAGTEVAYAKQYNYDSMGRLTSALTNVDGQLFTTATEYDTLGRPWRVQDASGLWLKTQYGPRGPAAICASEAGDTNPMCPAGADTFQRTLATDQWGNVVREGRADNAAMEVRRQYHAQTGRISEICAGTAACNVVKEAYAWDAAGNLSTRQKEGRYLETFTYDNLNRLSEGRLAWVNGVPVNQVTLASVYDGLGNICSKDGVGYGYPGADGCIGASALMAESAAARPLADYLQPTPRRLARPSALQRGVLQAPDYAPRRYSEADSRRADSRWEGRPRFQQRSRWQSAGRGVASASQAPVTGVVQMLGAITGSPHAVSQTGEGTAASFYYYDDRGNQTLRDAPGTASDRTIRYTADGMAHEIQMGNGQRVRFWYGPDGQRYKREEAGKTTLYVGGVEVIIQGAAVTSRRYVAGVALQTVVDGIVQTTRFLFHDHLGSLVRMTGADGVAADGLDYTPFGQRRSYADPNAVGSAPSATARGFTGHEYVDGTGIIHMNGRIYDAELGRFLQPDPLVQAPGNGQSWNAYTYVFNNPLVNTDPTGNFSLRQVLAIVIAVVAAIFQQYYISANMMPAAFAVTVIGGFAAGYVASGTMKGGVYGAFGAALTFGAGIASSDWGLGGQMVAQGVSGGIMESLQGGSFGNGFASAGLTAGIMPQLQGISNNVVRTATGAMIGGTISEATGGKFANGAVSGAVQAAMMRPAEANSRTRIDYQEDNAVGNYAVTPEERQAFIEEMVKRGKLGNPKAYSYVDDPAKIDPVAYMKTKSTGFIEVYPSAFETFDYYSFGASLYHEYVHSLRYSGYRKKGFGYSKNTQPAYMSEAEAYIKMLSSENPFYSGLNKRFIYFMRNQNLNYGFGALTPSNQARAVRLEFDCTVGGGC